MKLSDEAVGLVGTDIEYPEFDPWGLTKGADAEKIAWYRAAELKHGTRIAAGIANTFAKEMLDASEVS